MWRQPKQNDQYDQQNIPGGSWDVRMRPNIPAQQVHPKPAMDQQSVVPPPPRPPMQHQYLPPSNLSGQMRQSTPEMLPPPVPPMLMSQPPPPIHRHTHPQGFSYSQNTSAPIQNSMNVDPTMLPKYEASISMDLLSKTPQGPAPQSLEKDPTQYPPHGSSQHAQSQFQPAKQTFLQTATGVPPPGGPSFPASGSPFPPGAPPFPTGGSPFPAGRPLFPPGMPPFPPPAGAPFLLPNAPFQPGPEQQSASTDDSTSYSSEGPSDFPKTFDDSNQLSHIRQQNEPQGQLKTTNRENYTRDSQNRLQQAQNQHEKSMSRLPDIEIQPPKKLNQDREWLNQWLSKKYIKQRSKRLALEKQDLTELTIADARCLLREALVTMKNLSSVKDEQNVFLMKKRLATIQMQFSEDGVMEALQRKIEARRRKRSRLDRQRERRYKENQEKLRQREQLEKQMNAQLTAVKEEELRIKREKDMKKVADEAMSDVRRKLTEMRRNRDVLKALQKLRQIRRDAATQRKGQFQMPGDVSAEAMFQTRLGNLEELASKQLQIYEDEQKTLQVMLEAEQQETEEREKEQIKQRLQDRERRLEANTRRMLFGRSRRVSEDHPLYTFQQYQHSAEDSIENFLAIRRMWDLYLVPENTPGGSRMPPGWVTPGEPSSDIWTSALKHKESGKS